MKSAKKRNASINCWPKEDRPREKLFRKGEHNLSNSELLAILLRTGVQGSSAVDLARKILDKFKTFRTMSCADISHWKEFKGLGTAKIAQIKASIEIGRRFGEETKETKAKIKSSKDAAMFLMPRMRDLSREVFKILLLDSQNRIIDIAEITEGTVNEVLPIVREIFQKALQNFAASIICIHNHPSGNPQPSVEDKNFTRKLTQAGEALQVTVLDHIVIGNNVYFSFADKGLM
ncbi:MAG: DNA repair protein RadC [Candidatus Omnitrophica bacterium]|nr:DNA repair protein RadC [Candidatus Omnitrophota bacterium]